MDMIVGSRVEYFYPAAPDQKEVQSFVGTIEFIGETFVDLRSDDNVIVHISYKNYDRIIALDKKKELTTEV